MYLDADTYMSPMTSARPKQLFFHMLEAAVSPSSSKTSAPPVHVDAIQEKIGAELKVVTVRNSPVAFALAVCQKACQKACDATIGAVSRCVMEHCKSKLWRSVPTCTIVTSLDTNRMNKHPDCGSMQIRSNRTRVAWGTLRSEARRNVDTNAAASSVCTIICIPCPTYPRIGAKEQKSSIALLLSTTEKSDARTSIVPRTSLLSKASRVILWQLCACSSCCHVSECRRKDRSILTL
mmetsp:Transcript_29812/g.75011  ORF Transcript_29812/g.75011 Transcript_29812/m.75011 type:complete len:236 (-) Transcript_29812:228-935(-)